MEHLPTDDEAAGERIDAQLASELRRIPEKGGPECRAGPLQWPVADTPAENPQRIPARVASVGEDETEGVGPRTRREPQGAAGTPGAVAGPRVQRPWRRLEKQTGCQGEPYGVAQSQR